MAPSSTTSALLHQHYRQARHAISSDQSASSLPTPSSRDPPRFPSSVAFIPRPISPAHSRPLTSPPKLSETSPADSHYPFPVLSLFPISSSAPMPPPPASLTAPSSPYLPLNSLFVTACRRTIVVLHLRRERWPPSAARRLRRGWGSNREEGGGDKGGIKGRGKEDREGTRGRKRGEK